MKSKAGSLALGLCLIAGIFLLAYPTVSDSWNRYHMSRAVQNTRTVASELDESLRESLLSAAMNYNAHIKDRENPYLPSDEEILQYDSLLNVNEDGIMGDVRIPKIGVNIPIYHGTEDRVLSLGAGHVSWSALPVGGDGCCCVISGHTGLASSKLFTELDELEPGDMFALHILGEDLLYQVYELQVVEPEEVEYLLPEEGKDICILLTCTPYGINTHRLLVKGIRVETEGSTEAATEQQAVR